MPSESVDAEGHEPALEELADAINTHHAAIVGRWLEQVAKDADAAHVPQSDLRDGIDEYVDRLAEVLRKGDGMEHRGVEAWVETARSHALTRVRIGFDISQLVHEFSILRRVLFDAVRDHVHEPRQAERVADLMDGAVAAAVKSYVDARDFEQRKQEAQHIGFLTHELRNPLNVSILATSRLRLSLGGAHEHELSLITRGHDRLRELIDQVLRNERLELGEVEVHAVDVVLSELVDNAIVGAQLAAAEKGIALEVRVDPEPLHVDPELLGSAVQNLVDNAVKFTDHGRVQISTRSKQGEVVVDVYDNCDGLSAEELRTIVHPFKRGHTNKPGSGLGLAIARRAVEAHGGRLEAESTAHRGCHFWITLPRALH